MDIGLYFGRRIDPCCRHTGQTYEAVQGQQLQSEARQQSSYSAGQLESYGGGGILEGLPTYSPGDKNLTQSPGIFFNLLIILFSF